ncbi:hypothetical protein AKO1_005617 [Acrasis kona]|uniref:Ankyrin repeat-containing protein n=1 Tax=Acrasis kona TaxID=1008807 RepID=A0AAW2YLL6_9EUKA
MMSLPGFDVEKLNEAYKNGLHSYIDLFPFQTCSLHTFVLFTKCLPSDTSIHIVRYILSQRPIRSFHLLYFDTEMNYEVTEYLCRQFPGNDFSLACRHGHQSLVSDLNTKVSQIHGFYLSCLHGHMDLVKYFLPTQKKLNWGLNAACLRGNISIIDFLFSVQNDLRVKSNCLTFACRGLPTEMVIFIINRIQQSGCVCNWDDGLIHACIGGNIDNVKLMIYQGATNFDEALKKSCSHGHLDITKLLLEKEQNPDLDEYLLLACSCGSKPLVDYLIDKGANQWDAALVFACLGGNIEVVELMIFKGACSWNDALLSAIEQQNFYLIELMILKGATNIEHALVIYYRTHHVETIHDLRVITFMVKSGDVDITKVMHDEIIRVDHYDDCYITKMMESGRDEAFVKLILKHFYFDFSVLSDVVLQSNKAWVKKLFGQFCVGLYV